VRAKVLSIVTGLPYRQGPRQQHCSAVNVPEVRTRGAVQDATAPGRAEIQGQIIDLLRTVGRSLGRQHVRLAADRGFPLSGPYFVLLQEIIRHPGVTVSELARLTGLPKSRVSVLITRLVAERAVRRSPDEHDSRLVLLTITPEGRRRAAEWSAASRQAIGRLLRPLCDEELADIASGLTALEHAFWEAERQGPEEARAPERVEGAPSC
jgi:DNA-binding MarR family transcriptional regulator